MTPLVLPVPRCPSAPTLTVAFLGPISGLLTAAVKFYLAFSLMAPAKGAKKEKIFHPKSRKAAQVERAQLRKSKLSEAATKKTKHTTSIGE